MNDITERLMMGNLKTVGCLLATIVLAVILVQTMVAPAAATQVEVPALETMALEQTVDTDAVSVMVTSNSVGFFFNWPFLATVNNSPFLP